MRRRSPRGIDERVARPGRLLPAAPRSHGPHREFGLVETGPGCPKVWEPSPGLLAAPGGRPHGASRKSSSNRHRNATGRPAYPFRRFHRRRHGGDRRGVRPPFSIERRSYTLAKPARSRPARRPGVSGPSPHAKEPTAR